MSFLDELLNVKGSRATSSSLEKTTSSKERDDTEHLGGRPELEDGEEISVIVTQHVSSHGDSLFSDSHALTTQSAGIDGVHNLNIESLSVVVGQVLLDEADNVAIMGSVGVEPEDSGAACGTGTRNSESHPISDRQIFHLTHSPDIISLDAVF
jgi:hypothetical protein